VIEKQYRAGKHQIFGGENRHAKGDEEKRSSLQKSSGSGKTEPERLVGGAVQGLSLLIR